MISIISSRPFTNSFYQNLIAEASRDEEYESPYQDGETARNSYFRKHLNLELHQNIAKEVVRFVEDRFNLTYANKLGLECWINKVTPETNKSDDFHFDISDFTLMVYLNSSYEGGELVWRNVDFQEYAYKPIKFDTVYLSDKLSHKVNPVREGIRYSAIFFGYFNSNYKELL